MFHSYCIIGPDQIKRQEYIFKFLQPFKISVFDIKKFDQNPVTISDVRILKKFLSRKPLNSTHKAVLISADFLTQEAEQALLKTLEEPPEHSLLILETTNADSLLPTIISRCLVIKLNSEIPVTNTADTVRHQIFWQKLLAMKTGERLTQTTDIIIDRSFCKKWILTQIEFFQKELLNYFLTPQKSTFPYHISLHILKKLIKNLSYVEKNISLKLTLDNLFIEV